MHIHFVPHIFILEDVMRENAICATYEILCYSNKHIYLNICLFKIFKFDILFFVTVLILMSFQAWLKPNKVTCMQLTHKMFKAIFSCNDVTKQMNAFFYQQKFC